MLQSGREMERDGHRVSFWFEEQLLPWLRGPGVRRLLVPLLIAAKLLRLAATGERPDIVEIHERMAAPYAWLAARLPRLPACVVMSHGVEERVWEAALRQAETYGQPMSPVRRRLVSLFLLRQIRVGFRNASTVIVLSSEDELFLRERLNVAETRIRRCSTGVDESLFSIDRSTRRPGSVIFVGDWNDRKGSAS